MALPDLRFKWVGAFDRYIADQLTNLLPSLTETIEGQATFSPLEVGGGDSWQKYRFGPAVEILPFTTVAKSSALAEANDALNGLITNQVVTSLDFTPTSYALVTTSVPNVAGFHASTSLANVGEVLAQQTAAGYLTTAIAADGATVHLAGGKVVLDTKAYEAKHVTTEAAGLEAQAVALGADGYIITAFGRSGTSFLLVGTRVAGATVAHDTVLAKLGEDAVVDRLRTGYAIVGMAFLGGGPGVILQR